MLKKLMAFTAVVLFVGMPAFADTAFEDGATLAPGGPNGKDGFLSGRSYLLDNGTTPNGSGRTVSGIGIANGWTVFQPFTVPSPGWDIDTIGVDGWNVQDPMGFGMLGTLLGDDGGGNPDENNPIADATYFLGNDAFSSNWRDEAFDVVLTPGTYWMRWTDNKDDNHWSAIFAGVTGDDSFSRRTSDGAIFPAGATALRIAGTVVPEPTSLGVLALGLLTLLRRR